MFCKLLGERRNEQDAGISRVSPWAYKRSRMIVQELLTEIFDPPACFSGGLSVFAREKGDDEGE